MNDTRPPQSAIQFTHPERLYWPDDGVTKEGLADYYAQVWKQMAPFVVNRPLALLRCPEGIEGQRFFQKHAWRGINKAIEQIRDPKDKAGEPLIRITDFDGMMALVQSAALEIHPWGSDHRELGKAGYDHHGYRSRRGCLLGECDRGGARTEAAF